jgi:hypothetical protein
VNVLEGDGLAELEKFGVRSIPVVARGTEWVSGQDFAAVARLAGIQWRQPGRLPPSVLAERSLKVMAIARQLIDDIPQSQLDTKLPARPRTYRELFCHIFQIFEVFLDYVERGRRVTQEDYTRGIPDSIRSTEELLRYADGIRARFAAWWQRGRDDDFQKEVMLHYGRRTLEEFMERTTWHAMQHVRQLQLVVETLGIKPSTKVEQKDMEGLPLPEHIFDDEVKFGSRAARAI